MNDVTLLPGDSVTVRSSDGSALNYTPSSFHPDALTISVEGGGVIPPQPSGACSIAVFQPSTGQIALRHSLSSGYAEEYRAAPDPHGTQVAIGAEIWSFRDGVWTAPSGAKQQFGQAGDIPLGGKFGSAYGKGIGRNEARSVSGQMTPGRVFKFPPAEGAPEEWIGSGTQELSFAHCWGNAPGQWWLGQAYPGGLWLRQYKHGAEKRLEFDYRQGDYIVSALFDGTHAGLARVRAGHWSIWWNIDSLNPNQCDHEFDYGSSGDVPLAGQFA